jgi:ATP-dependent helicase/nuclease subunit A
VTLADAPARTRAATDLDTPFLVEASAGSGKTTLLVHRILAWVASGRARLPEIVAITFTERAAADLRLKVREAVEAARAAPPSATEPALDRALADLELCPIRTIHGFCADLLRERPVEAGIDPGFAVADPLETELCLAETWEGWLERAVDFAPPALADAISLGVPVEALAALGRALVRERDLLAGLPPPVPEDVGPLNREAREHLVRLAGAVRARVPGADSLARELCRLATWVQDTDALAEMEQITALLTELRIPATSKLGTQAAWGKEPLARARAELTALADRIADARAGRLHNLTAALAGWLTGFVDAYRAAMRRRGLLDFHDLLVVTRDLLRGRPDVRRDFQRRYRTLLVDEFQDTDPLQLEIAFFLAEDPDGPAAAAWDAVRLGPGRLFLVGDPKQSIYRFRRADIETYERARELLVQQGEVLRLDTNFRSGRRLLAAVNRTFEPQMQPPDDGRYQPAYAPLGPAPDAPEGEGPILLEWPSDARPPASAPERRAREARALAELVAEAVGQRAWVVRDRVSGTVRPATYGDVVLLFRALVGVTTYEDALRQAGAPYRTLGGRHYYARSEVGWALAALTAIDDPHDPVALVAALRSPLFGAPDGAFLTHAAAGGRFSYLTPLPPDAHPALEHAWRVLRDLHERRVHESPTTIVEALFAETEVLATYALDPHGDQRVANLLRILDTARALEARGRSTFRALVRWLRTQDAGGYEESESPVAEEGDDVVRLMTVHAAKGLEFPVVILPDLEWDRGPGTRHLVVGRQPGAPALAVSLGRAGNLKVETLNLAALGEREARREAAEQLRLFYVATTRARDYLVLPLLFGAVPRGFAAFCAPLLDDARGGARRMAAGSLDGTGLSRRDDRADAAAAPDLMRREDWAARRDAVLAAAASALAPPGAETGRGRPRRRDARLGALVRQALALADLAAPEPAAAVRAAAERLGGASAPLAAAERLVATALAAPPYRRAARAQRVVRDLPVAAILDDELIAGVLPLVFEEAQGWVVLDASLEPADEAATRRLAALAAAVDASGWPVAEACLLVLGRGGAAVVPVASKAPRRLPVRPSRPGQTVD